jgi:hypothetical protein
VALLHPDTLTLMEVSPAPRPPPGAASLPPTLSLLRTARLIALGAAAPLHAHSDFLPHCFALSGC